MCKIAKTARSTGVRKTRVLTEAQQIAQLKQKLAQANMKIDEATETIVGLQDELETEKMRMKVLQDLLVERSLERDKADRQVIDLEGELKETKWRLEGVEWDLTEAEDKVLVMTEREEAMKATSARMVDEALAELSAKLKKPFREEKEKKRWWKRRCAQLEEQRPAAPIALNAPNCEICRMDFGDHPDRVPRVLDCGHTLCTECCSKIANSETILCPFDRTPTYFREEDEVTSLPKNFTVLEMVTRN